MASKETDPVRLARNRQVSRTTIGHYDQSAEQFRDGTWDHDVSQNIQALLSWLPADRALRILDFGCGPGRDLVAFRELGHQVTGLEGSARFCAMARQVSGCPVLHQDFLALELPPGAFDGVFANASLFHIPSAALLGVLGQLHAALDQEGVLLASIPRGRDEEGWQQNRYGVYHSETGWRSYLDAARFSELDHYYRPPGLPREQQPWLVTVSRRLAPTG